jgi:hypothetical protein
MRASLLILALMLLAGCSPPILPLDAGPPDTGLIDTGTPVMDAGSDARDLDVGVLPDTGMLDASVPDGGVLDGGTSSVLTVVGGFGTLASSSSTGGSLTVVGGSFSRRPACSTTGSLCVIGGFSR